jgi:predicted AAA+ superfamily ATPase
MPRHILPRLVEPLLRRTLADTPVVLIQGPRQCGKTTLAQAVGSDRRYGYLSLDDPAVREAAIADPSGFVADLPPRVVLDEVQRAPEIFTAIKATVDRRRIPGHFLLTGSTNVMLLPKLADSLAGRLGFVRLHPLTQAELQQQHPPLIDRLFRARFRVKSAERLGRALATRIVAGGFPSALTRRGHARRRAWYRDYVDTIVQRDVRDLAKIASLQTVPRLLSVAATQTAQLLNVAELAGPFQVSRPTIADYMTLLQRVFLIDMLPPWHQNRLNRLVKTPKMHIADTGLACALLNLDADALWRDRTRLGPLLETFVLQELRRLAGAIDDDLRFHHYRDRDGYEVDIVIERGNGAVAGVEVKASSTVTADDFRGLRRLRDASGGRMVSGVVFYDGEAAVPFGNGFFALPISYLWDFTKD